MILRKLMGGNLSVKIIDLPRMKAFAALFSGVLKPGESVALDGGLGSGKTTFTQAFCQALGITHGVTSPTFTLLNEYEGVGVTVIHGDLYRLEDREMESFLPELEARMAQHGVITLVEWAEKAPVLEPVWTWRLA